MQSICISWRLPACPILRCASEFTRSHEHLHRQRRRRLASRRLGRSRAAGHRRPLAGGQRHGLRCWPAASACCWAPGSAVARFAGRGAAAHAAQHPAGAALGGGGPGGLPAAVALRAAGLPGLAVLLQGHGAGADACWCCRWSRRSRARPSRTPTARTASSCARSAPAALARALLLVWDERYALVTVLIAAFGRAVSEVGAVMIVGGNIDGFTRVMTTAIALETSKGDLPLALALGPGAAGRGAAAQPGDRALRGWRERIDGGAADAARRSEPRMEVRRERARSSACTASTCASAACRRWSAPRWPSAPASAWR